MYYGMKKKKQNIFYLNIEPGGSRVSAECNHFLIQHTDVQSDGQSFI